MKWNVIIYYNNFEEKINNASLEIQDGCLWILSEDIRYLYGNVKILKFDNEIKLLADDWDKDKIIIGYPLSKSK